MAKLRYLGPERVSVPVLGVGREVDPDELVEVPDELVWLAEGQTGERWPSQTWEMVEEPAPAPWQRQAADRTAAQVLEDVGSDPAAAAAALEAERAGKQRVGLTADLEQIAGHDEGSS